jgi:hypothetical protein
VIVAERASRDRVASDAFWCRWLPTIRRGALDERNEVKKAVNWALRAIGKRNGLLNGAAIDTAGYLKAATAALAESSKKIDGVLEKADATMGSAKKAADEVHAASVDARKTIQAATQVLQEATHGKGLLAALLTNQELAKDLHALVSNLRAHGILFYRDSAAKSEVRTPAEQSQSTSRKSGGR